MSSITRVLAGLAMAAVLAGCGQGATPPETSGNDIRVGRTPDAPFQVSATDLGIHSFTTQPQLPTASIRLSCYPGWSQVNPARNEYNWVDFDRIVDQVEAWGYQDIVYVFCSTPQWAGNPSTQPDEAAFGPGTAEPPADVADFATFVRAVAERYKGRIDGYETWNEPGSRQFFTGTPEQMGAMTQAVRNTVSEVDPTAYVLSAGFQTHVASYYEPFVPEYLADLRTRGWPVDGISAHFYPPGRGTPEARVRQIQKVQADLERFDAPADLPLWDTEVNYAFGQPGGAPEGRISGRQAAGWVAQTYLNSWRTGVRRAYWYLWTADYYGLPGIQVSPGTSGTAGLQTLGQWVIGATFDGCESDGAAQRCSFTAPAGTFEIAWSTTTEPARISVAADAEVCPVDGQACTRHPGGRLAVDEVPVRVTTP